uniref:Uncharacterized protein n=1 Tax=Cyprinodon variegatus TaxID=28743 RepID=A0A3Q2FX86_CYPVA
LGWGGIGAEVFLSLPCMLGANGSVMFCFLLKSWDFVQNIFKMSTIF